MDSEGDVYVSSAGESPTPTIKIFDPEHIPLGSITESEEEPCGLAVDSNGNLYVSEKASGEVVKYEPTEYPFTGAPSYEPPVTIDSSGEAKGTSIDPFDDRLYVAKDTRIDVYRADGSEDVIDEIQRVVVDATAGTYTLSFQGEPTPPLPFNATNEQVEAALEALPSIGAGNVSVTPGPGAGFWAGDHIVTFEGALAGIDVPQLLGDASGLITGGFGLSIQTNVNGFSGHIGEGELSEATGVAAYTSPSTQERYLFVADLAGPSADRVQIFGGNDIRALKLRRTIEGVDQDRNPGTPDQGFGFGPAGAYLASDMGYCPKAEEDPEPDQACTAGHFFVYDDAHEVVDELEASGEFLTQVSSSFEDAQPTAVAVDRSGGSDDGTLYVTSGASVGAKVLAFGPLPPPSRPLRPDLSFKLETACGVAVDAYGDRYVAAGSSIRVYDPAGNEIKVKGPKGEKPIAADNPCDLTVDSQGNLYALDGGSSSEKDEKAVYYTPAVFPPVAGTKYSGPTVVAEAGPPCFPSAAALVSIGINPANDRLFVNQLGHTIELDSAANESKCLDPDFASGFGTRGDIAVYGANGNIYLAVSGGAIAVLDKGGKEVLAKITGAGSPKGPFGAGGAVVGNVPIAVDQENGHLLIKSKRGGVAEEYEASGAFVTQFGSFENVIREAGIAIDNGTFSPNKGKVFVAYDDPNLANPFDLAAFDPLVYGGPPVAVTGVVSEVGGGEATLNGTVDPRGSGLEACNFEYATEEDFVENGFSGAASAPCVPDPPGIGSGTGAVPVSAQISGLDAEERYRFRLVAQNKYGTGTSEPPGLFGPLVVTDISAKPVSFMEATLRATIDPSGLPTQYHFEYGLSEEYGQSTPVAEVPPGSETEVEVPIFGLQEGTTYHFRLVAENEANACTLECPDQTLTTLVRPKEIECPNEEFRTGRSANLPDCRAYELVTPADTRGATPYMTDTTGTHQFNDWPVDPRGENAGESVAFFIDGTLPGFDGNGLRDGYRARRTQSDGPHPKEGWGSALFSPSYQEDGGDNPAQQGVASDQEHSFWEVEPSEIFTGTLQEGRYLRTPVGFEPIGQGSLGTDLEAEGWFISVGGGHVIFSSSAHLESAPGSGEPEAAPAGTEAVYDRAAGDAHAQVVSVKPDGSPFGAGEDAEYVGATEDGTAILFEVDGALYLHRGGETIEVAQTPNSFAGISEDGERVFYADDADGDSNPANLFAFDVGSPEPTEIAPDSRFVNVSADGSHVYFTSEEVLDAAEEGVEDADNLYVWDGATTSFIGILDPADLSGSDVEQSLTHWSQVYAFGNGVTGLAQNPSRSTPDGTVFIFQSHAELTADDSGGHSQVYRYDAGDGSLLCVSCDPSGAPTDADGLLQSLGQGSPASATTLVPNLTINGSALFFESRVALVPGDANGIQDVYEWRGQGSGGCETEGGCLALISSGQGEQPSYLYGMTPDGHDVFLATPEKLVGADITGSPSIYDARVEGGIPDPPPPAPCQGDACQGQGSQPPTLPTSASSGGGSDTGNPKPHCPKGKHRVVRRGNVRCVKKHHKTHKKRHRKARAK